jgi:hypothetical protein
MKPKKAKDQPEAGKLYSLTGAKGTPCIANGNSWAESEFIEKPLTEEQKEKNLLNDLGIDYSDLDESGDMLEELKEIGGFYDN